MLSLPVDPVVPVPEFGVVVVPFVEGLSTTPSLRGAAGFSAGGIALFVVVPVAAPVSFVLLSVVVPSVLLKVADGLQPSLAPSGQRTALIVSHDCLKQVALLLASSQASCVA